MARVGKKLEFIAMKAVAAVGEQVKDEDGGGDDKNACPVDAGQVAGKAGLGVSAG